MLFVKKYKNSFMTYIVRGIHVCAENMRVMARHGRSGYNLDQCDENIAWLCRTVLEIWPGKFEYSRLSYKVSRFRDKLLGLELINGDKRLNPERPITMVK
ncbi:MAG: hypothetical protein GY710_25720 [Desulfobacteraceae bacterium]|nr:hypothetical protein [Desulfobacteraceae bacterium]